MDPRTAALCALALLVPADHSEDFTYRPDAKVEWTLSFTEQSNFELESMVQTLGGVEVSGPTPEMTGAIKRRVEATDQGRAVEGGRMVERGRTFGTIESDCALNVAVMGQEQVFELSFGSELEGEELQVTWSEEAEEHQFGFASDDSPEAALLEGLLEDLDFQLLLPPDYVEEGDSWELDLKAARALFAPGGNLHLQPEEAPSVSGNVIEAHDLVAIASMSLAESSHVIEGELIATWSETVERGESKVAVVTLEVECTFEADLSDSVQEMAGAVGINSRESYNFTSNWELEGEGVFHWDLSAGHFRELELELESIVEIALSFTESFGDIEVEVETSGTSKLSASAAPE